MPQTEVYTNDTVAVMSGCDLCFTDANYRFLRQDAVLAMANRMSAAQRKRPRVHVVHSTPACYVEASKQLSLHGGEDAVARVNELGEAVATVQHHDGITGTSTEDVAHDYANILYQGIKRCELVIASGLVSMMNPGATPSIEVAHQLGFCHLLNQSDCPLTEREHEFTVLVYNPASVPLSSHVRLPIGGTDEPIISVVGPDGEKTESQVVQLVPHRHAIPEVLGNATSSLVFQVTVEPLGASLYHVKREPSAAQVPKDFLEVDEPANFIENERFRIVVNPETGLVSSVVLLRRGLNVQLRQTFGAYLFAAKAPGNMSPPGHYVFSAYREAEDMGDQVTYRIVKGPVVQEIHQIFNGFVSQVIAVHKDSPHIEFTWTVGPLTKL
ncbi:lysosomal alpha-mannosidase-like [Dermacentor andersoni]|uniref:lysosomal alpha-mannosidase-like n=1 Tax=Dermacentor andersoni TaxID=34620 RepID=UPI003B3AB575